MKNLIYKIVLFLPVFALLSSCNEDLKMDAVEKNPPVITGFSPASGKIGTEILITGENFRQVNKILIGDGEATLKYRVNDNEVVAVVTAKSKTGVIEAFNQEGSGQSTENFTITYAVPAFTTYPTSGAPGDEVLIEGNNLDAVTKVLFGSASAVIVVQSEKELLVRIPYFENSPVDISLEYFDGAETKAVSTNGNIFNLDAVELPTVTESPTTGETGATITIRGTNLHLIDEVWFGESQGIISQRTDTYLNITIPEFAEAQTLTFKLVYFNTQELVLSNAFTVTIPAVLNIHFWGDRTVYCQDPETAGNFFDAQTGRIYTPCQYEEKKNDIYMVLLISGGNIRLTNPNNSANATKVFTCNGEALPAEKMPNIVKYRVLKTTGIDNKYVQLVKNKELTEITDEMLNNDAVATTSSNNIDYPSALQEGTVLLMKQFDGSGNVLKVGFIEVLTITTTGPEDKTSSMTFNCYFQK